MKKTYYPKSERFFILNIQSRDSQGISVYFLYYICMCSGLSFIYYYLKLHVICILDKRKKTLESKSLQTPSGNLFALYPDDVYTKYVQILRTLTRKIVKPSRGIWLVVVIAKHEEYTVVNTPGKSWTNLVVMLSIRCGFDFIPVTVSRIFVVSILILNFVEF